MESKISTLLAEIQLLLKQQADLLDEMQQKIAEADEEYNNIILNN